MKLALELFTVKEYGPGIFGKAFPLPGTESARILLQKARPSALRRKKREFSFRFSGEKTAYSVCSAEISPLSSMARKADTISGSNCVPEQRRNSSRATSISSLFR